MDNKLIILNFNKSENEDYYKSAVIKILQKNDFTYTGGEEDDTLVVALSHGYRLWKFMNLYGYKIDMDVIEFNLPSQIYEFADCIKQIIQQPYRPVFKNQKQMSSVIDTMLGGK